MTGELRYNICTMNKEIQNSVNYYNEYSEEDKEMSRYYLGEELISNSKILDSFLSDANSNFDSNNPKHVRIFAKLDRVNDILQELAHDVKMKCV